MEVGDFVAVLTYLSQLFVPLNYLGSVYSAIVMAVVDLANLSELLAETPDVIDAPDAFELPPANVVDPTVAIEFQNVYFNYPTQNENRGLKGLSFTMKRGTTTAIVGPTGELSATHNSAAAFLTRVCFVSLLFIRGGENHSESLSISLL